MADGVKTSKGTSSEARRRRLAAELRSNLGKRKQQARAREELGSAPAHQGDDNPKPRDR